jgi:hypothetical protein
VAVTTVLSLLGEALDGVERAGRDAGAHGPAAPVPTATLTTPSRNGGRALPTSSFFM